MTANHLCGGVNISDNDEYVICASQKQDFLDVLLGLGNVIYWLYCQNTNIPERLNYYLNYHNLHG